MCEELVKGLDFNRDTPYPTEKNTKWTILIPSKNRLDKEITYNKMAAAGIIDRVPTYLVVEPQEYEEAKAKGFNCVSLDKNDQGILYARNWILRYAEENKLEHVCVMDDDIGDIGIIDPDGQTNIPGEYRRYYKDSKGNKKYYIEFLLETAEKLDGMASIPMALFAHETYKKILKTEPSGIDMFASFYQVMLYNMKYMPKGFQIRDDGTNEDIMQLMQLFLEHDVKFYRIYKYVFVAPKCGSNSGGMSSPNIVNNKYDHWHENAIKLYGDYIKPEKKTVYGFRINTPKLTKLMKERFCKNILDLI